MHRLACLLLAASSLAAQKSADASIGVWPFLFGDIDAYQQEIINKAKQTGLDTLYLSIWRSSASKYGTMYIADEAKTWSTADGALVPRVTLGALTRKAHAAGLQVVGVLKIFDSKVLPSDYGHQDHVIQKVIRYLVHSYDSAGRRVYPLDGIALDYIRWFGGNHTTKEVNRFLDEARKEVGVLPIHAYVIAGAYAIDGGTYDNKFRTYSGVQSYVSKNFGQNWEEMARRIDVLMPMTYTANGHVYKSNLSFMEGYVRQAASYARTAVTRAGSRCRVVPAIRTWNSSGVTTTKATVEASCRGAMKGGANGFMAFRYFTARGKQTWFDALANHSESGTDLPIADLTVRSSGSQVVVDTAKSHHGKVSTSQLVVRLDLDGDGRFEVGPHAPGTRTLSALPGRVLVTAEVTDPKGHVDYATVRFGTPITFLPITASVSRATGGSVAMLYGPGSVQSGKGYIVFASVTGTSPGTPLGGSLVVPLVADPMTDAVYASMNTLMFPRFTGTIPTIGLARPSFVVPAGAIPAQYVGTKIYFAAVGFDRRNGAPLFTSNPITVTITK